MGDDHPGRRSGNDTGSQTMKVAALKAGVLAVAGFAAGGAISAIAHHLFASALAGPPLIAVASLF